MVPTYMNDQPLGTEELGHYITPPRLKIVQKQSGEELLAAFGPGDIIIVPDMQVIAAWERSTRGQVAGEAPHFTLSPIFFFPEWAVWNPLSTKGQLPAIRERTLDPKSDIAAKARDPERRIEDHPDVKGETLHYVEHLNFICMVADYPNPVVVSFSRGEHKAGRQFANLVKMRRAPLYGCSFTAVCGLRSNNQGSWYGLDIQNNEEAPWIAEDAFAIHKALFIEYNDAHQKRAIQVNYEDPEPTPPDTDAEC